MLKLLQITPAEGWFAIFQGDDGVLTSERISLWGLYEDDDGFRWTDGVVQYDVEMEARDMPGFITFAHRDDLPEILASIRAECRRRGDATLLNGRPA